MTSGSSYGCTSVRPVVSISSSRRMNAAGMSGASMSIVAPYPRAAAIFIGLAVSHMTTSASMPSTAAAYASACAWFPAEIEITPRRFSSSESVASLFRTPRGLNEPVRWKSSALKATSTPARSERVREPSIGVRCSRPAIRPRAASTSSSETSGGMVPAIVLWEDASMASVSASVPARILVEDDLRRSRLTVFFRLLLAIPHFIWLFLWTIGAIVAAILSWFATLALGRPPQGLSEFLSRFVRYATHVNAYVSLAANPYPAFTGDPGYPIIVAEEFLGTSWNFVGGPSGRAYYQGGSKFSVATGVVLGTVSFLAWFACLVRGRMPQGFRNVLAWGIAVALAVIANWFATLALGRSPSALHRFISSYVRYQTHVYAFLALVANPFPGFVGRPGTYPIDLEIDPPERQHRLVTLGRLPLVIPAFFVDSAASSLLFVTAFLGWFSSLAPRRMPTGLPNAR